MKGGPWILVGPVRFNPMPSDLKAYTHIKTDENQPFMDRYTYTHGWYPKHSMYGICTYIYPKKQM